MAFGDKYKLLVQLGIDHAKLQKDTNKVSKTFNQLGSSLQMAGLRMSVAFTAPAVMFVRAMVKELGAFEQKMTRSTAIMGDLSTQMKADLIESAAAVAAEVPRSAKEAAEGYFFLASAGLDAAKSIKALPAVMDFAIAGNFDLARATSLSADAQSALGLKSDDAAQNLENLTRVTDVLVKANTLANATTEQFSRSLTTKAGAAIKIVGKSIEEGTAILAAFADQGIKSEMAGTALNIVFRDLKTKGLKFKQEWAKLGGVFDKTTGQMRPMADIIEGLENHIGNLSPELAQTELKLLGFSDKSLVFTQALIGMSDKIREYERALKGAAGTTKEVADKQIQNLADQFKMAKQRVEGAIRAIAVQLRPVLVAIVGIINLVAAAMRGFAAALDNPVTFLIPALLTLLAGVVALLGPLALGLSLVAFAISQVSSAMVVLNSAGLDAIPILKAVGVAVVALGVIFGGLAAAGMDSANPIDVVLKRQRKMIELAKQAQADFKTLLESKTDRPNLVRQMEAVRASVEAQQPAIDKLDAAWSDLVIALGFAGQASSEESEKMRVDLERLRDAQMLSKAELARLTEEYKSAEGATHDAAIGVQHFIMQQRTAAAANNIAALALAASNLAYDKAGAGAQEYGFVIATATKEHRQLEKAMTLMMGAFDKSDPKVVALQEKMDGLKKLVKSLGGEIVNSTVVIGRFAQDALDKAQQNMEEFIGTAVKLNEALAPGQFDKIITEFDFLVQAVREYEGALQKIIEEGLKEDLSLEEIFNSEEFGPQINAIIERITALNKKIAEKEPYEKAREHVDAWLKKGQESSLKWAEGWTSALDQFSNGMGDAFASALVDGENFGEAMEEVFKGMLKTLISTLAEMVIQWALSSMLMSQATNTAHAAKIGSYTSEAAALAAASAAWAGPGAMAAAGKLAIGATIAQASLGYALGSAAGAGHGMIEAVPAAKGGIFTNPTLALIGEAGAEAVVPLTGPNGFGGSQNISLYMDGRLITETVLENMPDEVRLNIGGAI